MKLISKKCSLSFLGENEPLLLTTLFCDVHKCALVFRKKVIFPVKPYDIPHL